MTEPLPDFSNLIDELGALRREMLALAEEAAPTLAAVQPDFHDSARNLLHYLALRRRDLRPLQSRLGRLGLSTLGRAESCVLQNVTSVLQALERFRGGTVPAAETAQLDFSAGQRLLTAHTDALFGPSPNGRAVRIMVTMPSAAASNYTLVHDLVRHGMDCMRINCAHDDVAAWAKMVEHLRRAERAVGRQCKLIFDLAGPKLRTGPLEAGPEVIKVRPQRTPFGEVVAPARIWLTARDGPPAPSPADAMLPVPVRWRERLRPGDKVHLRDARGATRKLTIADVTDDGAWAELTRTTYFVPGLALTHGDEDGLVGRLPPRETALRLAVGDELIVTRDEVPGRPASFDSRGRLLTPATIGCTLPQVFEDVQPGERIWFDDGRIGGVIDTVETAHVRVRITHARPGGTRLMGDKGINLPDSHLRLPALTAQDLGDLAFVVRHADIVSLSFANSAEDVESLLEHIKRLNSGTPGIVLKIETRRGFENLPSMLLAAMRAGHCGVMIARGDLAVECGFERLAEIQEEILWVCEAAHVPVIWATQVLESLAKEGMPSRAEITDAAMGHRAECVMLNKGAHIIRAVEVLDDILRRMQSHQAKKRAMLRELRLARKFPQESA